MDEAVASDGSRRPAGGNWEVEADEKCDDDVGVERFPAKGAAWGLGSAGGPTLPTSGLEIDDAAETGKLGPA